MSGHDDMTNQVADTIATEDPQPAPLVLRILSGLHDGASRVLSEQEMLLIGSGEDCDIILSDPGVARHHAMVLRHGDTLSLRAIDAPLEFAGDALEPGDPIDLPQLQAARLGGVSIAIGPGDDHGWTALGATPGMVTTTPPPTPPARRPFLPTALVAVALLSLVSVGIYAMVRPAATPEATPRERITTLATEHGVRDPGIFEGTGKTLILAGTVEDPDAATRLQERIDAESLPIELRLRTGQNVALDVGEVLRTFGISANTRYEGNGAVRVEPQPDFDDWAALAEAGRSRVMRDINGFAELLPPRDAPELLANGAPVPPPPPQVRVITWVTGEDPHVITSDGEIYRPGEKLPGDRGVLTAISEKGALAMYNGDILKLRIEPSPDRPAGDDATGDTMEETGDTEETSDGEGAEAAETDASPEVPLDSPVSRP